ncbi:MAG: amidase [Clostridia bacterium]|nr:amidase [Clostridia bacterium]
MTNDRDLCELSALELATEIKTKRVSPLEVIQYFEKRIKDRNPSINAFVYEKFDYARNAASALEKKLSKGIDAGPFTGVPFALKDFLPSKKGWQSSHGGVPSYMRIDDADSEFCKAMEMGGGIAIGKTNAPAFGFSGTCDNVLYGATKNPFNTDYNSGGSSGGSAAAVADGMVPIAEGSDGGGSLRIPAAWCSCVGYKASIGTIPQVIRPDGWSASHPYCFNGGITKTVEDTAALLNLMARYDPRDPHSVPRAPKDYVRLMKEPVSGMKIGFTPDFGIWPVDSEIADIVEKAALAFEALGAKVSRISPVIPYDVNTLADLWCLSISIDTAIELKQLKNKGIDLAGEHRNELPESFIYWNEKAAGTGVLDYYRFNEIRTALLDYMENLFENFDIIVSPVTVCAPVRNSNVKGATEGPESVNGVWLERRIGYCETFIENFTGHPAASVPAGLTKEGLPVGMHIIGKKFRDEDVLAAAAAFEKERPWRDNYKIPLGRI